MARSPREKKNVALRMEQSYVITQGKTGGKNISRSRRGSGTPFKKIIIKIIIIIIIVNGD